MAEMNEYDPYYYDRAETLADIIRIMDSRCKSFKKGSGGIRVSLVSEFLKNGLCRYIEDTFQLLKDTVELTMIVQIIEESIKYARDKTMGEWVDPGQEAR